MAEVHVLDHPLIQHKLAILRSKDTPVKEFRELIGEIAGLMCYEATRKLPLKEVEVETPVATAKCHMLSGKKLAIVPVLRAGLGMVDQMVALIPSAKIGHIGLTAHSTAVFAKALEMDWVETVMFPYNIVESQGEELIRQCGEKNVGFICMKPLAGGAIENATLALRYILTNPDVTVAIPGMAAEGELAQNLAAAGDASPLSDGEKAEMQAIRDSLGTQFCRRCNYCAPCSVGISIPNVFLMDGYLSRYGLADWARGRYNAMAMKAGDCIGCGECEKRCPYHLPIREMMQKVKEHFGA